MSSIVSEDTDEINARIARVVESKLLPVQNDLALILKSVQDLSEQDRLRPPPTALMTKHDYKELDRFECIVCAYMESNILYTIHTIHYTA